MKRFGPNNLQKEGRSMDTSQTNYSALRLEYGLSAILTVEETARFLRISSTTAYVAVRSKQIPSTLVGRQYRIYADQLLRWLEQSGHVTEESAVPPRYDTSRAARPTIKRRGNKNA
jgi:excisionase family DNA binding protein